MGLSSKDSRIYYVPHTCPISLDGTPPAGLTGSGSTGESSQGFSEQVTRIEVTPSVSQRKYGHDKSHGAQDVCSGIKSWDGSITTKVSDGTTPFTLTAGDTVWLRVYPIGVGCGEPIQGYAVIDSDPIVCNLENGEPVEHNYRYSSKGLWIGLPHAGQAWGGFECECGGSAGSGSVGGAVAVDELAELTHNPVTAYQWNGTAWLMVRDEAGEGFVSGAAPSGPGEYQGELRFAECVVG